MPSNMTPGEFISALHEEMDIVTDLVRDDLEDSNSFVTAMIPDGGDITDITQTDTIEYTAAKPSYIGYNDRDNSPRSLVEGEMEAQGCDGSNKSFTTNVNEKDALACDPGFCEFRYAQGYKRYQSKDFERPLTTPVFCANDYLRIGDAHVDGFFEGLFSSYRKYGKDNFEAELQNRVIQYGEANGSITTGGLQLSKGGWHAEPTSRLTIHYLLEYRDYMEYEDALDESGYLVIEAPRQDWFDAVTEHQVRKNANGANMNMSYDSKVLTDESAELYGRAFHIFENIKCVFNERPVRGFFKPDGVNQVSGATQLSFTRIFPWKNVIDKVAGVAAEPNHDYNKASTRCEGVDYPVVTLAFHIHKSAFERYRLKEAKMPMGDGPVPTNFSIEVLDGPWLTNNKLKTKFQLVSTHAYRLKNMKVERAGAIAFCHSRPEEYIILPSSNIGLSTPEANVFPQEYDKCAPTAETEAICEANGGVATDNHTCEADPGSTVISMAPSGGEVTTLNDGESNIVRLKLERSGVYEQAATVDYALTLLGSAVAGTNYTADSGTVTFAIGVNTMYIDVEILDGAGLDGINDGVKVTLSNPGGTVVPVLEDTYVDIIIVDATA